MTEPKTEISAAEVEKVAHLARLELVKTSIPKHVTSLSNILDMIKQINACDTSQVSPMSSPFLDASTPVRPDAVTEADQRSILQKCTKAVASGLYLVPQVIE